VKVRKLIEELSKLDPELMVVVRGYEDGVDEVVKCELCNIELDVNKGIWYYGKHNVVSEISDKTVKAVQLI